MRGGKEVAEIPTLVIPESSVMFNSAELDKKRKCSQSQTRGQSHFRRFLRQRHATERKVDLWKRAADMLNATPINASEQQEIQPIFILAVTFAVLNRRGETRVRVRRRTERPGFVRVRDDAKNPCFSFLTVFEPFQKRENSSYIFNAPSGFPSPHFPQSKRNR